MKHLAALMIWLVALPAWAGAERYVFEAAQSEVVFTYDLGGITTRGGMPVRDAEVSIDFQAIGNSDVSATLDAARATAGLIFATEAMRSQSVLDTARFPTIRFQSTAIRGTVNAAKIDGLLTVRGVTHPVTLDARLLRRAGSDPTDLSILTVQITGAVSRKAFSAAGYPDLVGDTITLDIRARIKRAR